MIKTRAEIDPADKWKVEDLYTHMDQWNSDFIQLFESESAPHWPSLTYYQGRLGEGVSTLKEAVEKMLSLHRKLATLYTYAHLRHDEDLADDTHKTAFNRISMAYHQFEQETSWFQPELLALSESAIQSYLDSEELSGYRHYLESLVRLKPHTLSKNEEAILAQASQALMTPYKTFCAINDTDFKFPDVADEQGKLHPLTHGQYTVFIRSRDRMLRKNTFETYHENYQSYQNTLAEVLSGQVSADVFKAECRHYDSALAAALSQYNIPKSVYTTLIQTVSGRLKSLHRYFKLKKQILNYDAFHVYDLSAPITENVEIKMPFDEAVEHIVASVAPLGSEYQNRLRKGLVEQRWVDRYENTNKRSGAYSSGCYDSQPYILMNYKGELRDVFTLAHEAGHSMHSALSKETQPYHYADYSIFLAEVASTFNEELLMRHLLKERSDPQEQIYLIHQKLEDIRGTLFRQTMFAEFEMKIHELIEKKTPLTPNQLTELYRDLSIKYFGPEVRLDDVGMAEWGRIPHFYYNFYVYQYATGISAALALCNLVTGGGDEERERYLDYLKAGSSAYPIDILRRAGVDMTRPEPVESALQTFDTLVDKLGDVFKLAK